MQVGLIGAGRIGTLHAGVLRALDSVDDLLITDLDTSRAEGLSDQLRAEHIDSPDDLFGKVDAVVIASSTDTHVPYLVKASEAGVPAFCEKPLSMDLASSDEAIAAIKECGIMVQMGFMRRFDEGYRAARDVVASGELGEVLLVLAQTHDFEPPSDAYLAVSGGIFADMLIHEFDIVRFVTGREILEVTAAGTNRSLPLLADREDYATVAVTAHLDDGGLAVITGVRRDPIGYDVRMEVFGTADSVAVGLDPHTPIRTLEPGLELPQPPVTVGWLERFGAAYRAEMEAFVELAAGSGSSPCTPEDARSALVVAEACRRAAAESRPVRIDEIG